MAKECGDRKHLLSRLFMVTFRPIVEALARGHSKEDLEDLRNLNQVHVNMFFWQHHESLSLSCHDMNEGLDL